MLTLKNFLDQSSGPYYEEITQERIDTFSKAVGSKLIHEVHPTFLTQFRRGEFDLFNKMNISLSEILHTDQEYHFFNLILPGDVLVFSTTITRLLEKNRLDYKTYFITLMTDFFTMRHQQKISIGQSKSTVIVRTKV